MKKSLGISKFDSIMLASIAEMVVGVLISLIDTAITGNIIGEQGLSAMNIISPLTGFTIFSEAVAAVGTSMLYARLTGSYEQEKADGVLGMGILVASVIGVATFVVFKLLLGPYLNFMDIHGQIRAYVMAYMSVLVFELMISPLLQLVCQMVYTDGDEYIGMASNIVQPLANIVFSIILCKRYGMFGIGLGTLVSTILAFAVLGIHFFSKRNTLHPRFYFSMGYLKDMVIFGWNDSAMFFVLPILFFITTKLIIVRYGEFYLPVLSVLYALLEISIIFESTGEAMRPILPIYMGDKNIVGVKRLAMHAQLVNGMMGIVAGILVFAMAGLIPLAFDIEDPELTALCISGIRFFALSCPALSELSLYNSYFLNTGREKLAILEMGLAQFICPLVTLVPCIWLIGINGIFIAFASASCLALVLLTVMTFLLLGRKGFPFYLEESGDLIKDKTINVSAEEIARYLEEIDQILQKQGISQILTGKIEIIVEETMNMVKEKNPGKAVSAECCLRINEENVYFTEWDNGEIFDITDEDASIISFRSYVLSRLVSRVNQKKHQVNTGFNRNAFVFPLNMAKE